jgi:hypothetical protein
MKTATILLLLSTFSGNLQAQDAVAVRLWADALRQGPLQQSIVGPGQVDELRFELWGKVSSIEVAEGFTVTLFDHQEATGHLRLVLNGPCQVDNLATIPMLALGRTWDGAIGSLRVERAVHLVDHAPVIADLNQ